MLIKQFSKCSYNVKVLLFKSFCCNFYCSQLWWHFNKNTENKLRIAFNKGLRIILKYDFMFSARRMFMENNLDNYDVLCRKYMFKFMSRISSNNNILVSSLSNSSFFS